MLRVQGEFHNRGWVRRAEGCSRGVGYLSVHCQRMLHVQEDVLTGVGLEGQKVQQGQELYRKGRGQQLVTIVVL